MFGIKTIFNIHMHYYMYNPKYLFTLKGRVTSGLQGAFAHV